MRLWRSITLLAAITSVAAANATETAPEDGPRLIVTSAAALSPVEDVLDDLSERKGYSFVYDSRLLAGRMISSMTSSAKSEFALRKYLADAGLTLYKTGRRSFAIALKPAVEKAVVANAVASPQFVDIILVSATAPITDRRSRLGAGYLFEIDETQLTYSSGRSAAEILHDLPLDNSELTPSSTVLYGALAGINYLDLRGFGSNKNAVLVNGKAVTETAGGNGLALGVDLSQFPTELLSRIELDPDSASARYSSSAFAGAVNFVLRSGYKGIESGAEVGVSERGDDLNMSVHMLAGRDVFGGAGNVTAGFSLSNRNQVLGKNRDFGSTRFGLKGNGEGGYDFLPGWGDSPITPKGTIPGVLIDGVFNHIPGGGLLIPSSDGTLTPFTGVPDQRYKAYDDLQISPAVEQAFGFVSFNGAFGPDIAVVAEAFGGVVATGNQSGPVPATQYGGLADPQIGDALSIPADNPTVPAALLQSLTDIYGITPDSIVLDRRFVEAGPRRDDLNRYQSEFRLEVKKGDIPHGYLSLGYKFGRTNLEFNQRNRLDAVRLQTALDVDACMTTPGCAPLDVFSPGGVSGALVDFAVIPLQKSHLNLREHIFSVGMGKAIPGILSDEVIARTSVDYKDAYLHGDDPTPAGAHPIGLPLRNSQSGRLRTVDMVVSLELPIVRWKRGVGDVDVALDYRATSSSVFDTVSNLEVAAEWRPIENLRFYFRHLNGGRPPNIVELFSTEATWGVLVNDPCDVDLSTASPVLMANCLSDGPFGVGADLENTGRIVESASYGNPFLEAEKTKSFAYGVMATPFEGSNWFAGYLELSATWRMFRARDLISEKGSGLESCYYSEDFSDFHCGINPLSGKPFITRDPVTRELLSYDRALSNTGAEQEWRGLDLELRYGIEPEGGRPVDRLWLNVFHTYTHKVEFTNENMEPSRADGLSAFPRHTSIISVGAERGQLGLEAHARRRSSVLTTRADLPGTRVPSVAYIGATLRYQPREHFMIKLYVENLTDRDPPILYSGNTNSNTLPSYYDVIGRRVTLSTVMRF